MITRKRKTFLLGLLGAATAAGMVLGATGVISSAVGEPLEVNAAAKPDYLIKLEDLSTVEEGDLFVLGAETSDGFFGFTSDEAKKGIASGAEEDWKYWTISNIDLTSRSFSAECDGKYLGVTSADWTHTSSENIIYLNNDSHIAGSVSSGARTIRYNSSITGFRTYNSSSGVKDYAYFYKVNSKQPVDLELSGSFKLEYRETDLLDLSGLEVSVLYDDGTKKELSRSDISVVPEEGTPLKPSDTKFTITYKEPGSSEISKEQPIVVTPRNLTSINVTSLPSKTEYVVGQSLDTTGLVVEAVYDYGDPADVTDDCVVEEVELTEAGNKTISVSYGEFSTSFEITVVDRAIEKLSLTEKTTSFAKGQKFTLGPAAKLVAIWNDGTEDEITLDTEGVSVEMLDSSDSELGTGKKIDSSYALTLEDDGKYISITYFGVKANKYQISVADRLDATRGFFKEVAKDGDLKVGDYILLAYNENVMGQQNGTYRNRVSLDTTPNGKITIDNDGDYQIVKLEEGSQSGSFALRVGNEYLEYHGNGNDVYTESKTGSDVLDSMSWYLTLNSEDGTFEIKNVGNSGRYLQYNTGSPRFACYKNSQKDPSIYKFVDVESIREFVDTYMYMSDYNENKNLCYGPDGYYAKAKEALVKLSSEQIEVFKTDSEFTEAHARYYAWSIANGDNSPYSGEYVSPALSIRNSDDVMDIAVISALAVAGIAAAGAFVFLRRKKEA